VADKLLLQKVEPLENFSLRLFYSNGITGEINVKKILIDAEQGELLNEDKFKSVSIDDKTNDILWGNGFKLCKNASYKIIELKNLASAFKLDL